MGFGLQVFLDVGSGLSKASGPMDGSMMLSIKLSLDIVLRIWFSL